MIAKDDPVTCAIYGRDKNLLDEPGWKRFKAITKREKKMLRQINQAKIRSYRCAPRYKFGYIVPRNYEHAVSIDISNDNRNWRDSVSLELNQRDDHKTFIDKGKGAPAPQGPKGYTYTWYLISNTMVGTMQG